MEESGGQFIKNWKLDMNECINDLKVDNNLKKEEKYRKLKIGHVQFGKIGLACTLTTVILCLLYPVIEIQTL